MRCVKALARVAAPSARRWYCVAAEALTVTDADADSVANRKLEQACGMGIKMSDGCELHGRALSHAYDQVYHDITHSGRECKLKFCPSYSDAKDQGPSRKKWASLKEATAKGGNKLHLHFNLYLEGINTQKALRRIAEYTGVPVRNIHVSGLKDSFSASTQQASIADCTWRQLTVLNDMYELTRDLKVGDLEALSRPVNVGEHAGTRFDFLIRNVPTQGRADFLDALCAKIRRVRDYGFVNYVGYQRFCVGAERHGYHVAAAMLQHDWRAAAEHLLRTQPAAAAAHARFVENDFEGAMDALAQADDGEDTCAKQRTLVGEMLRTGNPRQAVLAAMNKVARTHCLSSLQAYVWNSMVTRRLALGHAVLPGDLVWLNPGENGLQGTDVDLLDDNESVLVVKDEAQARQYTLKDVVIPLLGVVRDDEGNPQTCVYPEVCCFFFLTNSFLHSCVSLTSSHIDCALTVSPQVEEVSRDAHDQFLIKELGLNVGQFEEASGQAAVFHGMYRKVWAGCGYVDALHTTALLDVGAYTLSLSGPFSASSRLHAPTTTRRRCSSPTRC